MVRCLRAIWLTKTELVGPSCEEGLSRKNRTNWLRKKKKNLFQPHAFKARKINVIFEDKLWFQIQPFGNQTSIAFVSTIMEQLTYNPILPSKST